MDASRAVLLLFVGALLALSIALVVPYVQYFLLAVILAYGLAPLQARLEARIGRRIAASVLTAGTTVAVIVPLVLVLRAIVTDAAEVLGALQAGDVSLAEVETAIQEATGVEVALAEQVQSLVADGSGDVFGGLVEAFGALSHVLIGLGLTLFLLYYFLKDGDRFLAWLRWVLPVPDRVQDELYESIHGITRAVLLGHVLVAVVQGSLAGLGLFAVGIPNVLFWTAIMIVLSLLPIVGSFLVWGPAAVFVFLSGRPVAAAGLVLYGAIVVGVSDDYLRPVVVDRYAAVSPAVIVIGVLGGLATMGFVGVFVGPIVIGALRATIDVYREEYGPPTPSPASGS